MMRHLSSAFLVAVACAATPAAAQRTAAIERKLEQRVSVTWQRQDRGAALERLRAAEDLPLWTDRRVDLSASIDASVADRPLREVFALLGAGGELLAMPHRGLIYFGPRRTAEALPALAQAARSALAKSPQSVRRRWLDPAPWSFPSLSEPRQLLETVAGSAGATLEGADRVPHDLWPACSFAALSPIDQAVLLLAGFDLTLEISADGRGAKVVTIDFDSLPKVAVRPPRDAARGRSAARPLPSRGETKVFTLEIDDQPVGPVIDQLAQQLQLSVTWDESQGASREAAGARTVSCDVRKASLDQLLEALLAPAGLTYERDGASVRIRAIE